MANFFKNIAGSRLRELLNAHNHDGTNSEAVTVGTVGNGSVTAAKLAANAVETAKIKDANVTTGKIADTAVTLAKLAATAKQFVLSYQVEDLAAGADIANRVIFAAPAGLDVTLVSAAIIPQGAAAGIDDSNKCVIALSDGTSAIVSKEYDADPVFPAAAAVTDLGALDETAKVLAAGEKLYLSVTNGATANPPGFMLQVVYAIADAA